MASDITVVLTMVDTVTLSVLELFIVVMLVASISIVSDTEILEITALSSIVTLSSGSGSGSAVDFSVADFDLSASAASTIMCAV